MSNSADPDYERAAAHLAVMGHPTRLQLLCTLRAGPMTVGQLQAHVDQPQSLVSTHLGKLRSAGLVRADRSDEDARTIFYSLDADAARGVLSALAL